MMLFYSQDPPSSGYALNLANVPAALHPPDYHSISADEYRGYLRARWRDNPRPFVELARDAAQRQITLCSSDRPDLCAVLWQAIVGVAAMRGIGRGLRGIAGGMLESRPKELSGRYVPGVRSGS